MGREYGYNRLLVKMDRYRLVQHEGALLTKSACPYPHYPERHGSKHSKIGALAGGGGGGSSLTISSSRIHGALMRY